MRLLILFVCVGGCFAAAESPASPVRGDRIVGGVPTSVDKYPFIVQLQSVEWANQWQQFCGGSLVSTTAVLTAAHCVEDEVSNNIRVVVGTSSTSGEGGTVHFLRQNGIRFHQQYGRPVPLDNDIAVLLLQAPVTLGPRVQTIRLAATNYRLPDEAVLTAIGWGVLQPGGFQPEVLQEVDFHVINQGVCAERYGAIKEDPDFEGWPDITPRMLCAGLLDEGGRDACQGDSGGPVVHRGGGGMVLVGVVSWGRECAHPYYPGVLARVSEFTNWIIINSLT